MSVQQQINSIILANCATGGSIGQLIPFLQSADLLRWPELVHALMTDFPSVSHFDFLAAVYELDANKLNNELPRLMDAIQPDYLHPLSLLLAGVRSDHPHFPRIISACLYSASGILAIPDFGDPPDIHSWLLKTEMEAAGDNLYSCSSIILAGPFAGRLERLGEHWHILGSLEVTDLGSLVGLGNDITVHGDLTLRRLPRLGSLGSQLRVGGHLIIASCPTLQGLPADLQIDGFIYTDDPTTVAGSVPSLVPKLKETWMRRRSGTCTLEVPQGVQALMAS